MANDFYGALNKIIDAIDQQPGQNAPVDDMLTALNKIADLIDENGGIGGGSSGGGDLMIVHYTYNTEEETYIGRDKTYSEIYNHITNGGQAMLKLGNEYVMNFIFIDPETNSLYFATPYSVYNDYTNKCEPIADVIILPEPNQDGYDEILHNVTYPPSYWGN